MKKHAELIKAWADGAIIQVKYETAPDWKDVDVPKWTDSLEYRIKPKEEEDKVEYYYVNANTHIYKVFEAASADFKIVFDGKTHAVKKIVIKNHEWVKTIAPNEKELKQQELPALTNGIMNSYIEKRA
jgi:hypothetical protein